MPLYNEQAYLSECISSLYAFLYQECQEYDFKVLLVDDASTDCSQEIYETLAKHYPFNYVRHADGPQGYGNTILTLFQQAKRNFDLLITFDADLQHAPLTIKEIIQVIENHPEIDLVSTSRYLSYRFWKQNTDVPVDRYVTNMLITKTINQCFHLDITDAFCGLKGYKTSKLPSNLDDAGYAFPLVYWDFVSRNKLVIQEIETPIIYRLDRRARGEWKKRMKEYFMKLESIIISSELKQLVRQNYTQGIKRMTEIIDHFSKFPIFIYQDFLKTDWLD
ncbi:MAG: glycosyltransferase family 2 protein [Candidatus Hodarchaeota archaeon]